MDWFITQTQSKGMSSFGKILLQKIMLQENRIEKYSRNIGMMI